MRPAKTVKEVLKAVEWILTNIGWCRGACFRDKEGQTMGSVVNNKSIQPEDYDRLGAVCITGALGLVEAEPDLVFEARKRLYEAAGMEVMSYNDEVATSKQQMINLVRKAIKETK
jgi:hypothetical protein